MNSESSRADELPLQGMRVLSFCHYLQGPAAAQYLADMGADVVKVEPVKGAFERHWAGAEAFIGDVSVFFLCANRNKRSLAIDLKHENSKVILERLIKSADVVLENYRPGVMERLGLGYEAVKALNPAIIYASATGFGADGPLRDRPGQDLLVQARAGLIRSSGSRPTATGFAVVDQHGAAVLAMGISAAYAARLQTGKGTRIEGSLFSAGIDLQAEALTLYYSSEQDSSVMQRGDNVGTWFHEAPYGVYELKDGFVAISLNPVLRIAEALDSDVLREVAEVNAYKQRDRVAAILADVLIERRFEEISEAFDAKGVWYERVNSYDDLLVDEQAIHNGSFSKLKLAGGEATLVNHPLKFDASVPAMRLRPPGLGEHTASILSDLGFDDSEIDRFVASGAVHAGKRLD